MKRSFFIFLGIAVLSLGIYVTSGAQTGPSVGDVEKLTGQEVDYLKKTMAKPNVEKDKKAQTRMRLAALMIAQYAQSGITKDNPKNAALATLRDQALAVRKAIEGGKIADAKALIEKLSLSAPVNSAAKLDPLRLDKVEDFENIMSQFASVRLGGFGLEDYLDDLAMLKANPNAAEAQKIELFAKKISMIASLAQAHVPAKLGGAKTIEKWKEFSKDFSKDSLDLAKAASSRKADAISGAAMKLSDTCKTCHGVFQ